MKTIGLMAGLVLLVSNAHAVDVGVGIKAGTVGAGVEVSIALTKTLNARVSLTNIDVDDQNETIEVGDAGATGDIDADLGLDFGATALLLDWYVFDGTFHLTAGFMRNDTKLSFSGTLLDSVTVDGEVLDPSDINGDISGDISLGETFLPYIGVGWGRKAGDGGGISVSFELGVAMLDPDADFDAEVNVSGSNSLDQAELERRLKGVEDDANDDLDEFEAWPVVSIGINYAF